MDQNELKDINKPYKTIILKDIKNGSLKGIIAMKVVTSVQKIN